MIEEDFTFTDLVEFINTKKRFDFSRFGDGEWNAMFRDQKSKQNCDGHTYFPDMGDKLKAILESSPDYYIGLQNLAYNQRKELIDTITQEYDLTWCRADLIHRANIKHQIQPLFDALQKRKVILVAPIHLKNIDLFDFEFIEIPSKNCWLEYKSIHKRIAEILTPDSVVVYCASMMANVLIDNMKYLATQIDMGSVLDVWAGVNSRSYHRKLSKELNEL